MLAIRLGRPLKNAHSTTRSFLNRRTFNSTGNNVNRERLIRLEENANKRPDDPFVQDAFQRELIRSGYIDLAIARHESGRYATSESVLREARRAAPSALGRAGEGESVRLGNIFESASSGGYSNTYNNASNRASNYAASVSGYPSAGSTASSVLTSSTEPIYVQLVEGDVKTQVWKTGRLIMTSLAIMFALGIFVDFQTGGALSGGGGPGSGGGGGIGGGPARGVLGARNYEVQPDTDRKTFNDVKGSREVKAELQEVVAYLKDPGKFTKLGGKLPKGVLLTGPPGTGKTLIAKAVAGEAGVPFFYASGSEFEELYVGVGARRVRDLFAAARRRAPCIIFIDEIDAVGSTRQMRDHQAMKMTLNQLLVELDGFTGSQGIIVIAATNFPDALDSALVRPGRFDRLVAVPLPDVKGRKEILSHYLDKIKKGVDINVDSLARSTTGMSGADLANLVNIAAISAATANATAVTQHHLEEAFDRIVMGNARGSAVVPEEVRKVTAFHEGGHALVALRTEGSMPVHKATIVPRGQSLGHVRQLPEEKDSMQMTKKQLIASIDTLMAGRVAEELIFGNDNVTSGASNDLLKATQVAHSMVAKYGMLPDSPVGLEVVGKEMETSPETRRLVDIEVRAMLDASYNRVKQLLTKHRKDLDAIANALLEKETLTGEELRALLKN